MDSHSSGEDVLIKIRKPYTISKQREPWTEEEHDRFLEALKLHGRAWQQIEEHIGTKTAVQIRSHAQKFFSKIEKDTVVKGVPISQAIEIDIPPPRPKRKPTNPYPRKTSICASTSPTSKDGKLLTSVSSSLLSNQIPGLDKQPIPEEHVDDEEPINTKENEDGNSSDVFPFSKDARFTSMSSANKLFRPPGKSYSFGEFVPLNKGSVNQTYTIESYRTVEPKQNQRLDNYPTHVSVKFFDGSLGSSTQTSFSDVSYQESMFHQGSINPDPFVPSMSAIAAATVAAATAWWAAHGLLPSCPPLYGSFPGTPVSATGIPSNDTVNSGGKLDIWSKTAEQEKSGVETELRDHLKTWGRKKVDHSSCCPKTSSSTEAETDAVGKHDKVMEKESNKHDTGNQSGDSMNSRIRSTYNLNESWKEVSDEGRVAFQALFSRHELPQSFSPPHDVKTKESQANAFYFDTHNADVKNEDSMLPDLNSETVRSCSSQEIEKIDEDELLTFRLGHGNLKTRRVGFKPYKRCSAEANNERRAANASEEKCLKRTCFQVETLT